MILWRILVTFYGFLWRFYQKYGIWHKLKVNGKKHKKKKLKTLGGEINLKFSQAIPTWQQQNQNKLK